VALVLILVFAIVTAPAARSPVGPMATSVTGIVRFAGDWESGDVSQWIGAQCANTGVPSTSDVVRGKLSVVTSPVSQGRYAGRVDLPAASVSTSCEALRERTSTPGSEDWYGLNVRLPLRWREPSPEGWGLVFAQFNFQGIWGAPVYLIARARTVDLILSSGSCNDVYSSSPGCAFSSGPNGTVPRMVLIPRLAGARWHQLIVHVRWASDGSGLVEAWHRVRGRTKWIKRVKRGGLPTVQWRAQGAPGFQRSYDKIGAYRGKAKFPLTVWHDAFVVGTSFNAVAARLR
jgi:hypothetical protein